MAAANPTTHDAIIKHLYPFPEVLKATYENNTLWALLKKNFDGYGKNWHLPIRIAHTAGRSHSFANAKANKAASSVVEMQITIGANYSLYSVDGKLQRQTSNNKGALVEAFEFELESAMDAFNRNVGYDVYGNGAGSIGRISSGQATTVLTLTNANDTVKFEKGMVLQASTTNTGTPTTKAGTVTVASVQRQAGTVTLTAAGTTGIPTLAANDYLFPDGDAGLGVKGLDAWIPSADPTIGDNFFGLDRSTDPDRLAGSRVDGSSYAIEEAFQKGMQVAARNGGKPTHAFMNDVDMYNLCLSIQSRVSIVPQAKVMTEVGIGFEGIKIVTPFGTVDCYSDYNCPSGVAYLLDLKQWELKGPGQFPFIDARDGTKLLREDSADAYEGRVIGYYQMQCRKPAGNVRLLLPT